MKTSYVYDLCIALPQSVWEVLHGQFGGGPACTRLYECTQCRQELDAMTKQKKYELEEFKALHEEFQVRYYRFLVHSADPQSRSALITIFTYVIHLSVPTFQNLANYNNKF